MSVGSRIKELRENKNISRNELADLLGVTVGAISNYENEVSSPKEPILFKIMEVLKCDANYLFQDAIKMPSMDNQVSVDEYNIIEKYRSLDLFGQETVSITLDRERKRVECLQEKDKRISYLEENPIVVEKQKSTIVRLYTYMHKIASAGNGFYFDDIPTDTIEAPYLPSADFIIGVNGDSMEPTYKDGDLVYVEKRQIIETGEIGVFILNNECFIKEAGEKGLISHNKKYDLIPGSESIQCVGKVLGKVEMN